MLIAAHAEQHKLSEDELVRLAVGNLVAGHEITAPQILHFAYVLLTHPAQLGALRADLDGMPRAVEEKMRYVQLEVGAGFPRYAIEDVELGGVLVRAGEPVMVGEVSANRGETVFDDPGHLDLTRQEATHLASGTPTTASVPSSRGWICRSRCASC